MDSLQVPAPGPLTGPLTRLVHKYQVEWTLFYVVCFLVSGIELADNIDDW